MKYELVIQHPRQSRHIMVTSPAVPDVGSVILISENEKVEVRRVEQILNVRLSKGTTAVAKIVVTAW